MTRLLQRLVLDMRALCGASQQSDEAQHVGDLYRALPPDTHSRQAHTISHRRRFVTAMIDGL
jgi:hypothetical protein